ncbi:MAG TPA: archease [candidate division Zixibacteria bacterium]
MWKYRFLEDVVIADAAFIAQGRNLEELFANCALATFEVMVDTTKLVACEKREVEIENEKIDELLVDWLSELIFLKDRDKIFFRDFKINISKSGKYKLKASAFGEKIDTKKHKLKSDVKAVTYHLLEVTKKKNWKARVVLDV